MLPSGTPAPGGGAQSVASSLLRTNSGMMGGVAQAGSVQSQTPFSLVSPRNQYNTNSMLGNISNVSSLLNNHSFGRGGIAGAEQDPLSFTNPSDHTQSQQQFTIPQGGIGSVKLEPGEQNGQQQQLQALRGLGQVKVEPQHSDQSMFLHQQQQQHNQQQFLQLSRQNSQVAAALQHQRMLQQHQQNQQHQQHQQHQQQILKNMPQQRTQQLHQNSIPMRAQGKPSYEPGMGARRLTQYMYNQRHRPEDNNIEFWRKFIAEFFAPNGKKRWCVSMYGSGRQTTGVFPQDVWHCEICNRKPVRGFETTVEVLPRLCQIKYASGTVEELLYVDMPREYHNASGQIVLDYNKAIQESVFDQLRVVRDGQLRIIFNQDLKISSWEFCASHHEELIPRRLLIPQVTQIGTVVQKFQAANQNAPAGLSAQDLRTTCNSFVSSARQLAKALEVPLVNDLGYTKRYVRCLQISEVVNSMKDLIDYSRETGTGPIDSLNNFPRRTSASTGAPPQQLQQHEGQQSVPQSTNHHDQGSVHAPMQHPPPSNGVVTLNNPLSVVSSASTPSTAALLHQNSMNSRQENRMSALNIPYGGANSNSNTAQIPSTSSPSSLPPPHPNPSSPFPAPTQSGSHNPMPNSHGADPNDSQSSVQQILQEIMSSQIKGINGNSPAINGGPGNGGMGFGSMDGLGPSGSVNGIRGTMTNNTMAMNGRVGINSLSQDPTGMNHQLLGGFGSVNGFNNLHFDWKTSP